MRLLLALLLALRALLVVEMEEILRLLTVMNRERKDMMRGLLSYQNTIETLALSVQEIRTTLGEESNKKKDIFVDRRYSI